jgi:low temperature requirement protein LtrA
MARFRRWFWRPPRAHGEVIADRAVSFLELFYDLVYVVVISQAAHHLATHASVQAAIEFAIVFGLIWVAWLHGSLYYELHGREDGRTRTFVFVQMAILALLAVFTGDAADRGGTGFALTYALYLVVLTWLWYTVRRLDRPEFQAVTGQTIIGIVASVCVIGLSAFLDKEVRLLVWGAFTLAWVLGILLIGRRSREVVELGVTATESMVERFGLFTIIVLGEVVVGVVDGMAAIELDPRAMGTGILALVVGFGFWWIYFDFVGRRLPRNDGPALTDWMMSHLPITLSIAGAGAAMVSLLASASDERTPEVTSWLTGGSVAVGLLALVVTARSLVDHERLASVYRPLTFVMGGGAVVAILVAWSRPAPWLLTGSLVAVLALVWFVAVDRWLRTIGPGVEGLSVEVVAAEDQVDR